jgi:hypothetical protein
MPDSPSMPSCLTKPPRSIATPRALILVSLVVLATLSSPASATEQRSLSDILPPGHASCQARAFDAAEQAAHPNRRVVAISLERTAGDLAAERKWGKHEQFDDTPVVSATLRLRLRGDPASHAARLECIEGENNSLVCTTPACDSGQIRVAGEGRGALAILVGGKLKSGRFVGHYIHFDDSCEGRPGGPVVLESGEDDSTFSLAPAPKEACR